MTQAIAENTTLYLGAVGYDTQISPFRSRVSGNRNVDGGTVNLTNVVISESYNNDIHVASVTKATCST